MVSKGRPGWGYLERSLLVRIVAPTEQLTGLES